ncbi:MAG: hypothetical protein NUV56_03900 [Candidatus Uhrbacteria bacterium]|nr:hypothetical protein [Candidatus Uhrbacteria bacterium]
MQFSVHYPPFKKKTLIALTNNERARLLAAADRTVEEIEVIESPETDASGRARGADVSIEQDYDNMKEHRLKHLYSSLSERMRDLLDHEGYEVAVICVPEANKNTFAGAMHPDILKRIEDVVPKNLCSMDINNVVRILIDG